MQRNILIGALLLLIFSVVGFMVMDDPPPKPVTMENGQQVSTEGMSEFVQCLVDAEVVAYTSDTCPACFSFAQQFGGYDVIDPMYVECGANPGECQANMQTKYVPEVQIGGELFDGPKTLEGLSAATSCKLEAPEQ